LISTCATGVYNKVRRSETAPLFLRIKNVKLKKKLGHLAEKNRRSTQAQAEVMLEEAVERALAGSGHAQ